jgi:hypothetical protein
MTRVISLGAVAILAVGLGAPSFAQDCASLEKKLTACCNCTPIQAVPYVISRPGKYCLVKNLTTTLSSGAAIRIEADHVTLDLGGFSLTRTAGPAPAAANGIEATGHDAVTVRNGTVDGFLRGVTLAGMDKKGALVEQMRILNAYYEGIRVEATGGIIRQNQIVRVANTPEVAAAASLNGVALGMGIYGANNRVLDNSIADVYGIAGPPESESYGINLNACDDCVVSGNKISNSVERTSYGIQGGWSQRTIVQANQIINMAVGITAYTPGGIFYTDNVAFGCDTPYGSGVNGGNNR